MVNNKMLEDKERMKLLLRGRMSFTVYGPRSSGKTYRMHELFKEVGVPYIEINGIFVSRKMNFFKILTLQLRKYLGLDFDQQSFPSNLEAWTREMTQLVSEGKELIGLLDKLYIFIDDMEEITIDDSFISAFYDCCRLDLPFQFRFVFCGINYSDKAYQFKQPFRSLPTFCIPKPEELFQELVKETVRHKFEGIRQNLPDKQEELQKIEHQLAMRIVQFFRDVECDLKVIQSIANVISDTLIPLLGKEPRKTYLHLLYQTKKVDEIIRQVIEYGPMLEYEMTRKIAEDKEGDQLSLEYYPTLLMTSLHLAEFYPESEDKRRFQDYSSFGGRKKDLNRLPFKITRHFLPRIIAISETLQSMAKENDKEQKLRHHSLDFYACIENLREENRLKYNLCSNPLNSKVKGQSNSEEAKTFMRRFNLDYDQLMSES